MVIYYDPQRSTLLYALRLKNTASLIVYKRPEFWLYQLYHLGILFYLKTGTYKIRAFEWEGVAIMQFLLTFFVLFYSNVCMDRYVMLYHNCMTAFHRVVLFTMEIVVCMPVYAVNIQAGTPAGKRALKDLAEVQKCRRASVRYAVAACYLFFASVTGGTAPGAEWAECTRKGILTFAEAQVLQDYPGPTHLCLPVLTSWALQTVHTGLALDVFWQPRSDQHNHSHDRMSEHLRVMVGACYKVAHTVALPIPFPYFHLVNVILVLNFMVLGLGLATLETYGSIPVYFLTVLIFMCIREVAIQFSDPFGLDDVDFPVGQFLDYVFDAAISLLQAFSNPLAYAWIYRQVETFEGLTESQMTWPNLDPEQLYGESKRHKITTPMNWNREMMIRASFEQASKGNVKKLLLDSLMKGAKRKKQEFAPTDDEEEDEHHAAFVPQEEAEEEFDEVRNALQPAPDGKEDHDDDEDEPDVPLRVLVTSTDHMTEADEIIMINVDPTDLVSDVKYRMHAKSQVAPHHQTIKFASRLLDADRTLAFYNIKANDMVHLYYEPGNRAQDRETMESVDDEIQELSALRGKTEKAQHRLRSLREELGLALDAPLMSARAKAKMDEARHEELERGRTEMEEARDGIRNALKEARRSGAKRMSVVKELIGEAGLGAAAIGYMSAGAAVVGTGVAGTVASVT